MFDSDTILITDDKVLTRCASKYYNTFKVPTMIVDSSKKKRHYTNADKASLDIFCDNDTIGIIVNLSQEINTIMWDRVNRFGDWNGAIDAYYDNCLLSVLATIAIDTTKREYPINCMEEFNRVRAKYNYRDLEGKAIRPYFFAHVAKKKGFYDPKKKNYLKQMAPMDYLQEVVDSNKGRGPKWGKVTCSIGDFVKCASVGDKPRQGYVDLVLSMIKEMDYNTRMLYQIKGEVTADKEHRRELANSYYEKCINGIRNLGLNEATMRELIIEMDNPKNSKIRRKLWAIVFGSLGDELTKLLRTINSPVYTLEECKQVEDSDVVIYGIPFKRKLVG